MRKDYLVNGFLIFCLLTLIYSNGSFAANRSINLIVSYKTIYFSGKPNKAIAVNDKIPGPTLHFQQGDHVTINVYNYLDKGTTIHWHGLLVPWQMDGVEGISQKAISPGGVFQYRFSLNQSGTYWYHAHSGLQEQQGLYGAIIIDPPQPPHYRYTKDYVVVLSDWSNTKPETVFTNLKKEGDYYSPRFPLQASLLHFIHDYQKASPEERKNLVDDYKMMQKMRMNIYDISDVAYDAFLLNGHSNREPWTALVKVGDVVRLRFINAGADTLFHVKIPNTSMQMVHVQGNDINPYTISDFKIAPGETYDVLIKIQKEQPTIIYAESADTLGAAIGALVTNKYQVINYQQALPFPQPLPVTREMMSMGMQMSGMNHAESNLSSSSMHMNMNAMTHSMNMSSNRGGAKAEIMGTKYQSLAALHKTNDPYKPIQKSIKMDLYGYMGRFIWFINGVPEHKAHPITIEEGKRYRIIFTNSSMMHHPMHIHGHWFILRNGHGAYDPLLHTIDVAPGSSVVADIDADANGQWVFHCHFLYHMVAGMARVFQYSTINEILQGSSTPLNQIKQQSYTNEPIVRVDEETHLEPALINHPAMTHGVSLYQANLIDMGEDPFNNVQRITLKGLYGRDYDKLELYANDAEINKGTVENADMDIFYWRLIDEFWAIKGGANYLYRPAKNAYWQPGIGIEGLMPYFIDTDIRAYYHSGSAKLDIDLSRDSQMTNNFFIRAGIRSILASKTVTDAGIGAGLNQMRYIIRPYYRLIPGLNVFAEYEHEQDYGPFRNSQVREGHSSQTNTITIGLSFLL